MLSVIFASVSKWDVLLEFAAAAAVAAGLVFAIRRFLAWRKDVARRRAVVLAARDRMMRVQEKLARIHLLAKRLSLAALIDFWFDSDPKVAAAARAAMRTRPELESELAAMLGSDDRVRALK